MYCSGRQHRTGIRRIRPGWSRLFQRRDCYRKIASLQILRPEFMEFKQNLKSSRPHARSAGATSPPESFGFQGGAAGACANAQWHRCVSMYGDHAADFSGRNPIFWKKNRFFPVFATGIACNSSKNCKAVAPLPKAGATSPGESFGFQPGAAETCAQAQRFRCVEGVVVAGEILPRPP